MRSKVSRLSSAKSEFVRSDSCGEREDFKTEIWKPLIVQDGYMYAERV